MQGSFRGMTALAASMWRVRSGGRRAMLLLEDGVFAAVLIVALSGVVRIEGAPYYAFLLAGLPPWFYIKRILAGDAGASPVYERALLRQGWAAEWVVAARALAALPTLLIWLALALLAALLAGGAQALFALPYLLLCNILNGLAQGLLAAALAPALPAGFAGDAGASILLPLLFWTTPIAWPAQILPLPLQRLLALNPLYYLSEGARGAMLFGALPGETETICFFIISFAMGLAGFLLHRRVRRAALPACCGE